MKKIILASAATLLISMFAGCTAADDSTISSPRHSDLTKIPKGSPVTQTGIAELCKSYTTEGMRNGVTVYQYYRHVKGAAYSQCIGFEIA